MKDPNDAIDFIFKKAPDYAAAKGKLAELENFRHSLKAIKASQAEGNSIAAKEMEAYRSQEYQDLCKAIGVATEQAEALRWQLEAAKMRFEAWRTTEASNRAFDKMVK